MKKNIPIYCLFFLLSFKTLLDGQLNTSIQLWNTENGLANDWVFQILQDEDQYLWIATQNGLQRFDGYRFESFRYQPNQAFSLNSNWIWRMNQDDDGLLWLGHYLGGVNSFHPQDKQVLDYYNSNKVSRGGVRALNIDAQQNIYIGNYSGIWRKNKEESPLELVHSFVCLDIQEMRDSNIFWVMNRSYLAQYDPIRNRVDTLLNLEADPGFRIFSDQKNRTYLLCESGLYELSKNRVGKWQKGERLVGGLYEEESFIYEDQAQQLWICGRDAVRILDPSRKGKQQIPFHQLFPPEKAGAKVLSLFEDRQGNLWIGTEKGLLLHSLLSGRFTNQNEYLRDLPFKGISAICEEENWLWLANPEGLHRVAKNRAEIEKILDIAPNCFFKSESGRLYMGFAGGRLAYWELGTLNWVEQHPKRGGIYSLTEDKEGNIWIGSLRSLQRWTPGNGNLLTFDKEAMPEWTDIPFQPLLMDTENRLWVGSLRSGLFRLDNPHNIKSIGTAEFQQYQYSEESTNSLSNNVVVSVTEDQEGYIWVATDGGLNRINPATHDIRRYLDEEGFLDKKVVSMVGDQEGNLWGATIGQGIFRWNPETLQFSFFNKKDGLLSTHYRLNAAFCSEEGMLYFGADDGLQVIDPFKVESIPKAHTDLVFTEIKNKSKRLINFPQSQVQLKLGHDYQSLDIEFSTLHYYQAEKTIYRYLLEGVSDAWTYLGNTPNIQLTGLAPGNYNLYIEANNPDVILDDNEIHLAINIAFPWWQRWWAVLGYSFFFLLLVWGLFRIRWGQKMIRTEADKLQEMDRLKSKFFANITHEFRTPLTLINGLAEQLKRSKQKVIHDKGEQIQLHSRELLQLVNEILDLSKLEGQVISINYQHGNLSSFLGYLADSIKGAALAKKMRLHYIPPSQELWADFDQERIKLIVSNLVYNAIRYNPEGIDIYLDLTVSIEQFGITVRDTGQGIEAVHLPHLFDRYYQADQESGGTGIGLALVKEVVEQMKGTVQVHSNVGRGSTFEVFLPIINSPKGSSSEHLKINRGNEQRKFEHSVSLDKLPSVLIIEDNLDVRNYIKRLLNNHFDLLSASNGMEGIEKALETIPDLIISDIMMPGKDGFEVLQTLKKDPRTDHIPIILLTAKTDLESRLKARSKGADVYLQKPFSEAELLLCIQQLLAQRTKLQTKYQDPGYWQSLSEKKEDPFIVELKKLLEDNLADPQFGIPQICHQLGISRAHLYRKVKGLTGQSVAQLLKILRLQRAHSLLLKRELNVNEVAYTVGFNDPSYFTKLYYDQYGVKPSETRKSL